MAEIQQPGTAATASGPGAVLRIDDLRVTFVRRDRDLPVVEGVSFQIGAGETYGLVGESGCGKTTVALALMRYLARNGRVDGGSITFDGEDMLGMSNDRLREVRGTKLGMVYQDPATALNPAMRVGDQIAEVYRFHFGLSKAESLARALESLDKVAMPDAREVMRRYPFQLSGGQQQRVVIAMALAGDPRLLVLDEPTTGLDATVEAEVLDLIEELRDRIDAAILLISHNLGMVARMCKRVGVMYAGRIVEDGPARDVFTDPRHPYAMGLLRCVPRFGARKDRSTLVPIPGFLPRLGATLPGCLFAPRCELAQPECLVREPELFSWPGPTVDLDDARAGGTPRHTRCYFPDRVPSMMAAAVRPAAAARAATGRTLALDHVTKIFKDGRHRVVAVDDVSIDVGAGEIVGLVGESGSGKTTLANCVTGLYAADGGTMLFNDVTLADSVAKRSFDTLRAIQMVFQNPDATLNPAWSAGSILSRAVTRLAGLGGTDRRNRVQELARRVRVEEHHLEAKPAELSGGQKQRIAIARAFAGKPTLVVCDEPASALDVSVQASILNLLAELQSAEGVSYIFISHDLSVVRYLSDRIAVMYLAWLMEIGTAEDVFTPPQCPYTEALTSAIPTLDFDHPGERIPLRGTIPSLSDPPPGCRFQTRCPRKVGEICEREAPPWRDAGNGHQIRCHIPLDELREVQTKRLAEQAAQPAEGPGLL
jgi:peptide/nickel transport system ATP-binding protein